MGANIVGNCAEVYTKVLLPVALCELGMLKVRRVMGLFQHIFCLQLWAFWHFHSSSCLYILFSHRCRVMGDIKASKDCFNFTVTFPPKQRNPSGQTNHLPLSELWSLKMASWWWWYFDLWSWNWNWTVIPNVLYFTHGIVIKKFGSNGIKLPPEQHCKASQHHRVQEVESQVGVIYL